MYVCMYVCMQHGTGRVGRLVSAGVQQAGHVHRVSGEPSALHALHTDGHTVMVYMYVCM